MTVDSLAGVGTIGTMGLSTMGLGTMELGTMELGTMGSGLSGMKYSISLAGWLHALKQLLSLWLHSQPSAYKARQT